MTPLLANVAISVLFPQPLLMLVALFPVVGVEILALRRQFGFTGGQVFMANVVSTLFGLPLTFICMVLFNVVLSGGDSDWWSVGFRSRIISDGLHHHVFFPLAIISVIIPCFVLSVWIEGQCYLNYCIGVVGNRAFWGGIIRAHCYSYLVLLAIDLLWLRSKII
ncbi:MAG: hypothetical protein JWM68_456 [Verrucomicrobiales bacterium]|nr:hypothetical protein [Verrucomicrobiales bacterium]